MLDDIGIHDYNFLRHGPFPFSSKLRYVGDIPSILATFLSDISFSFFSFIPHIIGWLQKLIPCLSTFSLQKYLYHVAPQIIMSTHYRMHWIRAWEMYFKGSERPVEKRISVGSIWGWG